MDIFDLTNHLRTGASIEETAKFLCRSGTVDAVRRKAEQLGLIKPAAAPNRPRKSKAPRASRQRSRKELGRRVKTRRRKNHRPLLIQLGGCVLSYSRAIN
jgi:hypothetical protein